MTGQACSSHRASVPKDEWERRDGVGANASTDDSSEDSLVVSRDSIKRQKQMCPTTATLTTEAETCSDASLVCGMLEVAASLDRLAAAACNSRGITWRCLEDNARKVRASAVVLAKRVDATVAMRWNVKTPS